ncbi:MAG: adenine deaminase [Deltaproteobacteria bacterium]|nr:MAG: adenine deaminase [Deltaproteobacteria bacterium]
MSKRDLILRGGNIVDVSAVKVSPGDLVIRNGVIDGIYTPGEVPGGDGFTEIDIPGRYVAPGFIDGHLHIESSMLSPLEFTRAAVRCGTTTIFVDPHEIANVFGRKGVELFLEQARILPLDMYIGIPSCVPATNLEDSGGEIGIEDIKELLPDGRVYGLAEMMNFPGVINKVPEVCGKVELAYQFGKVVDGHCPGLSGEDLAKYISNGAGDKVVRIMSDHEINSGEEAVEKYRAGMWVMVREGSASKNLEEVLSYLVKSECPLDRSVLVSDDRDPVDLEERGHMEWTVNKARDIILKNSGLSKEEAAIRAIGLATLNTARYFRREEIGEVAVGKKGNLVVFRSLDDIRAERVISNGVVVAREGEFVGEALQCDYSGYLSSVNIGREITASDLRISYAGEEETPEVKVIGIIPDSIVTQKLLVPLKASGGPGDRELKAATDKDILKIAVFERHKATGKYAVGFVKGMGIGKGAVASTVSHDSHNLMVIGADDEMMAEATNYLSAQGGGIVAMDGKRTEYLPLQIGGLMSTGDIKSVAGRHKSLARFIRDMGSRLESPFLTMSFLALPVIPELRLTDRGLVDVNKFGFVELY